MNKTMRFRQLVGERFKVDEPNQRDALQGGTKLSESQAADQLEHYRKQLDLFMGLSFPTISSTGPNGAIIHYQPDPKDCATVDKDQVPTLSLFFTISGLKYLSDIFVRFRCTVQRWYYRRDQDLALWRA